MQKDVVPLEVSGAKCRGPIQESSRIKLHNGQTNYQISNNTLSMQEQARNTTGNIHPSLYEKDKISKKGKGNETTTAAHQAARIRTHQIGANPEKSDLVNFGGPD